MKTGFGIILIIVYFQFTFSHSLSAQKFIKIDDQLKENSQLMKVKRKGISGIGRYEFGSYKVISGKQDWEKGSSKSPVFGDNTAIKSSQKMSFLSVNKEADTCTVNVRLIKNIETDNGNWFSRTFLNWTDLEVKKGEGVFEAVLTFSTDTIPWRLTTIYPVPSETSDGDIKRDATTHFRGVLTHKNTMIQIKKVTSREDGKSPLFNPVVGYEFKQDSISLAAVQVMPYNKMYVWIRDDLEPSLKFVLANAATAMLIKAF